MGVNLPYRFITGLPKQAQTEIWRDFEALIAQLPNGAAATVFDATIDAGLSASDPDAHAYVNLTDLVANETLPSTYLFTVGVISRSDATITETANITIPGSIALIATGMIGTGPLSGPTAARQVWDLNGKRITASNGWVSVYNMQIQSSAALTSNLPFPSTSVYLNNCLVYGQDPTTSSTVRIQQVAGGRLWAIDSVFFDTQAAGSNTLLVGCVYNFHNSASAWSPGSTGNFYMVASFIAQTFGSPGISITGSAKRVYLDAEMQVDASTQEVSSSFGLTITNTGDTTVNLRGNVQHIALTVGAGAGHVFVTGNVWKSVLVSGNTNKKLRHFDLMIVGSGSTQVLDVTGPAHLRVTSIGNAAASGSGSMTIRGSGVTGAIQLRPTTSPAVAFVGATDCGLTINLVDPGGTGFQAYTIDSASARSLVTLSGANNSNFTVASTNAGTNCLVIDETGVPPTGTAGGDLSGTYPNPSVVDDSHNHTDATLPSDIVYDGDAAGGDLDGTYPDPTVVALQGNPVDATTPSTDDVMTWDGAKWVPAASAGGPPSGSAGGDLSGTYPNPSVVDDSHDHTATTLPSDIVYDGDAAGGDLTGTYPNPTVAATPYVSVRRGSNQSIPNNNTTLATFDTVDEDASSMFDSGGTASQFTIPAGFTSSLWLIEAGASFSGAATGRRFVQVQVNGSTVAQNTVWPSTTSNVTISTAIVKRLSNGDVITVNVFQDSGGSLNLLSSALTHVNITQIHR